MTVDQQTLQQRLDELVRKHQVVGASLAVLHDDAVTEAASGVLNVETGVEATTDSLFQIGSITKVYTASQVMTLVDAGVLDLDEPVVTYLPEFRVADPDVTATVTLRHLLSHTSGIDGDHFHDTGRGDDCLERYAESCASLTQKHPLGATMSYCNSGYSLIGRIVEKVTGKVWDTALTESLVAPLGLTRTVTLPEQVLLHRAACGHVGEPGEVHRAPIWSLMRSAGPAGLVCATAAEVVEFARMHLRGGLAASGTRVLSEAAVTAMREPQVQVPDRWTLGEHWGLGWILFGWGAGVFGHDGATLGQNAFLRVAPNAGVAIALLTNGGGSYDLSIDLFTELFAELAGIAVPERPHPPVEPPSLDLSSYAGTYQSSSVTVEFTPSEDQRSLHCRITNTTELAAVMDDPTQEIEAIPVQDNLFVARMPGMQNWMPIVFFTLPDGSSYIHMGARATRKVT